MKIHFLAEHDCVHRPEQFEFAPRNLSLGSVLAERAAAADHRHHQPIGIGRGYFDEGAYADLTRWMCSAVSASRRDHPARKPNPGMILQAVLCLRNAIDKMSDIEAASAAGVGLRILAARLHEGGEGTAPHQAVADLEEALALLRSRCAAPCGRSVLRISLRRRRFNA